MHGGSPAGKPAGLGAKPATGKPAPTVAPLAWAAVPLVALAGCVDAIGFLRLEALFVSFVSGTSTMLGIAAVEGDRHRALVLATVLGLFAGGAVLGEALGLAAGRWRPVAVLAGVAALLAAAMLLPPGPGPLPEMAFAMVPAMGMLNTALPGVGGITFVTGALSRAGAGLVQALAGRAAHAAWLQQAACWAALVLGAALGAWLQGRFGAAALATPMVAAAIAALLAVPAAMRRG